MYVRFSSAGRGPSFISNAGSLHSPNTRDSRDTRNSVAGRGQPQPVRVQRTPGVRGKPPLGGALLARPRSQKASLQNLLWQSGQLIESMNGMRGMS